MGQKQKEDTASSGQAVDQIEDSLDFLPALKSWTRDTIFIDTESLITVEELVKRPIEDGHDWGMMRAEYVNGRTITLKELAAKHGVSEDAVRRRSSKENWVLDRGRIQREFVKVATQEGMRRQAKAAIAFNNSCLDASVKLVNLIHKNIDEAEEKNAEIAPNELGHLARALKSAQEGGRLSLGLSTDNRDVTVNDGALEDKTLDEIDGELLMLMGEDAFNAYKASGNRRVK